MGSSRKFPLVAWQQKFAMFKQTHIFHLFAALLIIATLFVFYPVLEFEFLAWDDYTHLLENPALQVPPSWDTYVSFWKKPYFKLYIPVTYGLWTFILQVSSLFHPDSMNPVFSQQAFHLLNLTLHALNTFFIFLILRKLSFRMISALIGSICFGWHPIQAEAVSWISGLKDVLSGFLSLLSILFALQALECTPKESAHRKWLLLLLSAAGFLLAPLAKPSAITAPLIAWILAINIEPKFLKNQIKSIMYLAVYLIYCLFFLKIALWSQPLESNFQHYLSIFHRILIAGDAVCFWLWKLILPINLNPDYGRNPLSRIASASVWVAWIVPIVISLVLWKLKRNHPKVIMAWCIFLLGSLPNWGLIPFGFQEISTVADRYLYLSMLGIAMITAYIAEKLAPFNAKPILLIMAITLLTLTRIQIKPWNSTESLFKMMLQRNPNSFTALHGLGFLAQKKKDYEEAISYYQRALFIKPNHPESHSNLGAAYIQIGLYHEALPYLEKAHALDPDDSTTLGNLGILYQRLDRFVDATNSYVRAFNISHDPFVAFNLGSLLAKKQDFIGAEKAYELAARIKPNFADAWLELGTIRTKLNKIPEGESAITKSIELSPSNPEAWFKLSESLKKQGREKEANIAWQRAENLIKSRQKPE